MKKEKILVGLDMTDLDVNIIEHLNYFLNHPKSQIDEIHFINVIRNVDVPDEVLKEFPDLIKNALKEREAKMKKLIDEHLLRKENVKFSCSIKKGAIAKAYLAELKQKDIDYILLGRRENQENSGLMAQKLARRSACSILIIPEKTKPNFKKILVGVDFSEYSEIALKEAIRLAARFDAEIIAQHVYEVPNGYHYTGKSFEEFAEVVRTHAEKSFSRFMKKINTNGIKITRIYTLDKNDNKVFHIHEAAKEHKVDWILVGAKGRTGATSFLIGSKTEKLIQMDNDFPLMILKKKGQFHGLFDTLREI